MKILSLHTLYRKDVCIGIILTYIIGTYISKNSIQTIDILTGILLSIITFNFIYSFNQCTDWKTDSINKPNRAIPSGKIKLENGILYSKILFIISLIYPFFISKNYYSLSIFLAFPLIGLLYSTKPGNIKKIPLLASFITATGLFLTIYIGSLNSSSISTFKIPIFLYSIYLYLVITLLFKDIQDFKGDMKYRKNNMLKIITFSNLKKITIISLTSSIFIFNQLLPNLFDKIFVSVLYSITIIFIYLEKDRNKIYQKITRIMITFIIIYFLKTHFSSMY